MTTVISAGSDSGTTTERSVRHDPAPSIRAASISDRGIVRKKLVSRKVEKGSMMPV